MNIPFVKYQGTGNDFVILDQREKAFLSRNDKALIAHICDRRFGVGADGLMWIESCPESSFRMVYFNADGRESSMCGNGGRCIAHYAAALGILKNSGFFMAIDGIHEVIVEGDWVKLKMVDVSEVHVFKNDYVINTGSPHYVKVVEKLPEQINVAGAEVRYAPEFKEDGINVNFVKYHDKTKELEVATYERGVEGETLSCGTGVTAAALVYGYIENVSSPIQVKTKGGILNVSFEKNNSGFTNIWLSGPAQFVFSGHWPIAGK